jgi:hypothetical protein
VGGRELTWGESVEKKLKRASHAFLSVDDESTLCAEALSFVPQSLVVTAGTGRRLQQQRQQQQRKASGWTYHGQVGSWNGVWLPPHRRSSNHSNHSGLRRCGCYAVAASTAAATTSCTTTTRTTASSPTGTHHGAQAQCWPHTSTRHAGVHAVRDQ